MLKSRHKTNKIEANMSNSKYNVKECIFMLDCARKYYTPPCKQIKGAGICLWSDTPAAFTEDEILETIRPHIKCFRAKAFQETLCVSFQDGFAVMSSKKAVSPRLFCISREALASHKTDTPFWRTEVNPSSVTCPF